MRNLLARQDVRKNAPFGAFFCPPHQTRHQQMLAGYRQCILTPLKLLQKSS